MEENWYRTSDPVDPYEKYWDMYLLECRANKLKATFRDFLIWYQEQDFDD